MLFTHLNEVYSFIKNDTTGELMEWENKIKFQPLNNKEESSNNSEEAVEKISSPPKGDAKELNKVDSPPLEPSSEIRNNTPSNVATPNEKINTHDISKEDSKNNTIQQTKFGDILYRDYKKPPSYSQISIGNPFVTMPARSKYLIDENGQIRSVHRIRNNKDDIEEARDAKRLKKMNELSKTLLTDEVDFNAGFPGEYIVSSLDDISPFENIENMKRKKLFIPKNWRSLKKQRLSTENLSEDIQRFPKSLNIGTPNIFTDEGSDTSEVKEDYDMNKDLENTNIEILKNNGNIKNERLPESGQKEIQNEKVKKELSRIDEKKETELEAERLEEKIKEAKEESKQEGKDTKMTEMFNNKTSNNKPISMSLPTTLEAPEISRNLFDNNKNSNTSDNEKESGLNKKLIIEQINESEKQLVEIEDLTKNVKANLNKLKEELQAKKDDQRNIELNIIEVKQKNLDK